MMVSDRVPVVRLVEQRSYHSAPRGLLRLLAAVALLSLGAAAAGPQAGAPRLDRESELSAIREQIAGLRQRLEELGERRRGVSEELARTTLELRLQERRLAEARAERDIAEAELAAAERRLGALEERLEASRRELRRRLAELYRLGGAGPLRLLLSAASPGELLDGIRILRYLTLREASALAEHRARRQAVEDQWRRLLAARRAVEELIERETSRLAELRRLGERQRALLAEVDRRRRSVAAEAEALVDRERKLSSFLDLLYGRTPAKLAGTPIQELRGVLDWPLAGTVVAGFGPRMERRYRTRVPHNGVELAVDGEAPVRAVYPGEVVFAAPFEGYGPTVVLHHPARVFTLYAGLAELEVAAGDVLSLGAVLGVAERRLYFEIRVENRPQDPLEWLR